MAWDIKSFVSAAGSLEIRYSCFGARSSKIRNTVVLVLGRNEWLEKYEYIIDRFKYSDTTRLILVGHRSQGKSQGIPAYVKTYKHYVDDLAKLIRIEVQDSPYILMAHSMGALVSLLALLDKKISPRKVLFLSPLLGLPEEHMPRKILFLLCFFMTKVGLGSFRIPTDRHNKINFENNKLTHDEEHYLKVTQCEVRQRFTTFSWLYATHRALYKVFSIRRIRDLDTPIQVLVGGDERVVDPAGTSDWVALTSLYSKSTVTFDKISGARHELLAESSPYREKVYEKVNLWLNS